MPHRILCLKFCGELALCKQACFVPISNICGVCLGAPKPMAPVYYLGILFFPRLVWLREMNALSVIVTSSHFFFSMLSSLV